MSNAERVYGKTMGKLVRGLEIVTIITIVCLAIWVGFNVF